MPLPGRTVFEGNPASSSHQVNQYDAADWAEDIEVKLQNANSISVSDYSALDGLTASDVIVGDYVVIRESGYIYERVASGGHIVNSNGVNLNVVPMSGNRIDLGAWNPTTAAEFNAAVADAVAMVKPAVTNYQHTPTHWIVFAGHMNINQQILIEDVALSDSESTPEIMGANLDFSAARFTWTGGDTVNAAIRISCRNAQVISPGVDCAGASSGIEFERMKNGHVDATNTVENVRDHDEVFDLTSVTANVFYRAQSVTSADWSSIGGPTSAKVGDWFWCTTSNADISALGLAHRVPGTRAFRFDNGCDNLVVSGIQSFEQTVGEPVSERRSIGVYIDAADFTLKEYRGGWCSIPIYLGENVAKVTLGKIHPFNGRGLGDIGETAVTSDLWYEVETVASSNWSSIGGPASATDGDQFQATADSADITALGTVKEIPYNPTLVMTHPDCGEVFFETPYLDNGIVFDVTGGKLKAAGGFFLELGSACKIDGPRWRVLCSTHTNNDKPRTIIDGVGGLSVAYYSSSSNLSPDAGSPSFDFDVDLDAFNTQSVWTAQEDALIHSEVASRYVQSILRDNDDIANEIPSRQIVSNGRVWDEYRSGNDTIRMVYDAEGGEIRLESGTSVTYAEAGKISRHVITSVDRNALFELAFDGDARGHFFHDHLSGDIIMGTLGSRDLVLRANETERLRIDGTTGDVIINGWGQGRGGDLTISSGAVTPTHQFHTVDTEGSAGTDDLDTISTAGIPNGSILTLCTLDPSRDVTVKNGTGNIFCGADRTLAQPRDTISLVKFDGDWRMISYSDNI